MYMYEPKEIQYMYGVLHNRQLLIQKKKTSCKAIPILGSDFGRELH